MPVILSEAKDLAHEASVTLRTQRDPSAIGRFLAPLGMTERKTR
jgi:hypothetical protein